MHKRFANPYAMLFAILCVAATVSVVAVASQPADYLYKHLVVDDAIYYLKPALNLLDGHGYSFDGVYRTNGVQPLWAMVVVGLAAVLREPAAVVRAMALLSGLLWIAGSGLFFALLSRLHPRGALLGGGLLLLAGMEQRLAMWGMEAGVHCLLLVLTLWLAHSVARTPVDDARRPRRLLGLGLVCALLSLARVEYGLFAALLGGWLLLADRRQHAWPPALRRTLPFALPLMILGITWLSFSRLYFGEWTPVSGSVKAFVSQRDAVPLLDSLESMGLLAAYRATLSVLLGLFEVIGRSIGRLPTAAEIGWTLAAALSPLLLGSLCLWRRLESATPLRTRSIALVLVVFMSVHVLLLALFLRPYAGYCGWYMTGEIVALCLLLGGLCGMLRGIARIAAVPAGIVLVLAFSLRMPTWFRFEPNYITEPYVEAGRWAERWLPKGATIGSFASGYIALENPSHRVINLDGLINDGRYLRDYIVKGRVPEYFRDERIGYFVDNLPADQWRRYLQHEVQELPERLRPIHCYPSPQVTIVGVFATEFGDPALPAAPPHPLAALRVRSLILGENRLVPDAALRQLPAGMVVASTFLITPERVEHLIVPVEQLGDAVDAAGFAGMQVSDVTFADRVQLRAIELPNQPVAAGRRLLITTYWQALPGIDRGGPLSLSLQIGDLVVKAAPAFGTLPLDRWSPGQLLPHAFVVQLPPDLAAGSHAVRVGVLDAQGNMLAGAGNVASAIATLQVASY